MKRVTPSSKLSAILCTMSWFLPTCLLDVVDIDHVMDVVVLQHDLLLGDCEVLARGIDGVERSTEIGVGRLVTKAQRDPVETHLYKTVAGFQQFHVGVVVLHARLWQALRARSLGSDPEHPIFKTLLRADPDQ